MGTPFTKYSNLRLIATYGNKTFVRNLDSGSMEEGVITKVLIASVSAGTEDSVRRATLGLDNQAIYLEGYFTKPKFMPAKINVNTRLEAYLLDPATKREIKGEFLFDLIQQSRFKAVSTVLGSGIKGWFSSLGL